MLGELQTEFICQIPSALTLIRGNKASSSANPISKTNEKINLLLQFKTRPFTVQSKSGMKTSPFASLIPKAPNEQKREEAEELHIKAQLSLEIQL